MGFINPFLAVEGENKLQALDTWHPSYMLDTSVDHTLLTWARFSGGHFDMINFFGEGRVCWWTDAQLVPLITNQTLSPNTEFQSYNS